MPVRKRTEIKYDFQSISLVVGLALGLFIFYSLSLAVPSYIWVYRVIKAINLETLGISFIFALVISFCITKILHTTSDKKLWLTKQKFSALFELSNLLLLFVLGLSTAVYLITTALADPSLFPNAKYLALCLPLFFLAATNFTAYRSLYIDHNIDSVMLYRLLQIDKNTDAPTLIEWLKKLK